LQTSWTPWSPYTVSNALNPPTTCIGKNCVKTMLGPGFCALQSCTLLNLRTNVVPAEVTPQALQSWACRSAKYGLMPTQLGKQTQLLVKRCAIGNVPGLPSSSQICYACCAPLPDITSISCWPDGGLPCPAIACSSSLSVVAAGDCGCAVVQSMVTSYGTAKAASVARNLSDVIYRELGPVCDAAAVPSPYCTCNAALDSSVCMYPQTTNCMSCQNPAAPSAEELANHNGPGAINACFKDWLLVRATSSANAVARAVATASVNYVQSACTDGRLRCGKSTPLWVLRLSICWAMLNSFSSEA
jgi:hypothetical protein